MRIAPIPWAVATSLIALGSMYASPWPVAAQDPDEKLDAILEDIEQNTDRYSRFRSLLSDPDQAKRMAAFSGMMNSGILTLQNMAMDYAFNSGDAAMESTALRILLAATKSLSFNLELTDQSSDPTKKTVASRGGGFSITVKEWDVGTGSFTAARDSYGGGFGQGQVNGLTLHYSSSQCQTSVVLDDDARNMSGKLSCQRFAEPVKVMLSIR